MAGDDVVARLSRDEALVLFDWLHRSEEQGHVGPPEHHGEQVALWNFSAKLERELAEPFDPACRRLLMGARSRLAGPGEQPGAWP